MLIVLTIPRLRLTLLFPLLSCLLLQVSSQVRFCCISLPFVLIIRPRISFNLFASYDNVSTSQKMIIVRANINSNCYPSTIFYFIIEIIRTICIKLHIIISLNKVCNNFMINYVAYCNRYYNKLLRILQ